MATGANAALPHHATGDTPIAPHAPLLADFGCLADGYYSDITRRLPATRRSIPRSPRRYEVVCAAHDAVLAGLAPGMTCHEADRLARDVIEAAGHGERFVHRTGHGVGLEIHEPPYLRPGSDDVLEVGQRVQRGAGDLRAGPLSASATRTSCTSARTGPSRSTTRPPGGCGSVC